MPVLAEFRFSIDNIMHRQICILTLLTARIEGCPIERDIYPPLFSDVPVQTVWVVAHRFFSYEDYGRIISTIRVGVIVGIDPHFLGDKLTSSLNW